MPRRNKRQTALAGDMHRLLRYLAGNKNVSARIGSPIDIALTCPGAPDELLHYSLTNQQWRTV
jgi:hypothetical protein